MNGTSKLIKVVAIALAIPAIGYAVSFAIIEDMNQELRTSGVDDVRSLCTVVRTLGPGKDVSQDLLGACREVSNIELLGNSSIVAALIGLGIPVIYWGASLFAGENRSRIAFIFPLVLRISILLIAISVLLQGAILTYAAYIGESYAIERVHMFLIGGIAIGALVGGLKLIGTSFRFGKKLKMSVFGRALNPSDAPNLYGFVNALSEKLGAKAPEHIIVGLDPTFYVTSSDISLPGGDKEIHGETLYISAPLSRLLSREEFASVIGHELGHFRGADTDYSMRFAPVYAGLSSALDVVTSNDDEGASGIAKLPAIAMLSYMYEVFATNQAKISRDREHLADEAGAEASSPLALSTALIKVSLYAGLWAQAREENIARLDQGKISGNLSLVFQDLAKYNVEHEALPELINSTLTDTISHPTDTHPPVAKRLESLGIDANQITKEQLMVPQEPAIDLLDNYPAIEEEITLLEHKVMVAYGLAKPPEETERNHLLHATYSLAAAMVNADGQIDPNEVAVAEGIGRRLFEDFDSVEFREYCNEPERIPDIDRLTGALHDVLSDEDKLLVLKYLKAISEADEEVSAEEVALLHKVAAGLRVQESGT